MLSKVITTAEAIGILILSSRGMLHNSANVAVKAPKIASGGLSSQKMPKIKQLTKQAKLPSKLFFPLLNRRLPKLIPTKAAKVSPIVKKAIAQEAISGLKKATQITAEKSI